jgi:hypothetical protein
MVQSRQDHWHCPAEPETHPGPVLAGSREQSPASPAAAAAAAGLAPNSSSDDPPYSPADNSESDPVPRDFPRPAGPRPGGFPQARWASLRPAGPGRRFPPGPPTLGKARVSPGFSPRPAGPLAGRKPPPGSDPACRPSRPGSHGRHPNLKRRRLIASASGSEGACESDRLPPRRRIPNPSLRSADRPHPYQHRLLGFAWRRRRQGPDIPLAVTATAAQPDPCHEQVPHSIRVRSGPGAACRLGWAGLPTRMGRPADSDGPAYRLGWAGLPTRMGRPADSDGPACRLGWAGLRRIPSRKSGFRTRVSEPRIPSRMTGRGLPPKLQQQRPAQGACRCERMRACGRACVRAGGRVHARACGRAFVRVRARAGV